MSGIAVAAKSLIGRLNARRVVMRSGLFDERFYLANNPDVRSGDVDALSHYLRYGAQEGRNPSSFFDSGDYLARYPDVESAGMNPLVHYCLYGKAEGRQVKAPSGELRRHRSSRPNASEEISSTTTAAKGSGSSRLIDIYISCWLRPREGLHEGLIDLVYSLEARGVTTKVATNSEYLLATVYGDVLEVSHSLTNVSTYRNVEDSSPIPAGLGEVVSVQCRFLRLMRPKGFVVSESAVRRDVEKAYRFWRGEFSRLAPKVVLVWGSTSPLSRLQILLCREFGLDYLVLERGHFPETISVELIGQFAYGGSMLLPEYVGGDELELDRHFSQAVEWVKNHCETPYAASNTGDGSRERIDRARSEGKKVILFIGVNPSGSGISFEKGETRERHSLLYTSSRAALDEVLRVLRASGVSSLVVLKPHPADRHEYTEYAGDELLVEMTSNINDLIAGSDVVVTLSTTALARAVIEDKPVVTMSLTDLSGKGVAYECNSPEALRSRLRAALDGDRRDERRRNGKRYILSLFQHRLFGINETVPTKRSIRDLAEVLGRRIHLHTERERLEQNKYDVSKVSEGGHIPGCGFLGFGREAMTPESVRNGVAFVIPVYKDADTTKACIDSVIRERSTAVERIIVISDASPEPDVSRLLDAYAERDQVEVYRNDTNLGFAGTANRGFELAGELDVLLLNSDAIVPKRVADRLREAAYASLRIATATPFSNNAGVFSVPFGNPGSLAVKDSQVFVDRWDSAALAGDSSVVAVEMPIGHGFCLYVKRMALDVVGCFDEDTFGQGYYEEVDFCLRARKHGFVNVVARSVFVGHVGGVSFGVETSQGLRDRNRAIIRKKYPDHFDQMRAFRDSDPIALWRPELRPSRQ